MAPDRPIDPEIEYMESPVVFIDGPEEAALEFPVSTDGQDEIVYLSGFENVVLIRDDEESSLDPTSKQP